MLKSPISIGPFSAIIVQRGWTIQPEPKRTCPFISEGLKISVGFRFFDFFLGFFSGSYCVFGISYILGFVVSLIGMIFKI